MSRETLEQVRQDMLARARRLANGTTDPEARYDARMICYGLEEEDQREDLEKMFDP